jgi:hypothetical protein
MTFATWAMFGSLLINSAFGVIVGTGFSPVPTQAAQSSVHCSGTRAHSVRAPEPAPVTHRHYLVAVRMGWAAG